MKKDDEVRMLLDNIRTNLKSSIVFNDDAFKILMGSSENDVIITPIQSHSSIVYLLSFKNNTEKFIFKTRAFDNLKKLEIEVAAFDILSKEMEVPEVIFLGIICGYEVVIYRFLDKKSGDDLLSTEKVSRIWGLILQIQALLSKSCDELNLNITRDHKYKDRVLHYTHKYLDKDIQLDCDNAIDLHLNTKVFKDSMTIFSDRSSVNWVIDDKNITPIDFDLLLVESCLADFIQFIDDHRINTHDDRDTLISRCLLFLSENDIYFTSDDFHWYAVYRNLIQGACFYKISRSIAKFHYERALLSVEIIGEKNLGNEIKKILNEVAWI